MVFITGDYAFGHSVETTARGMAELGGKVAGSVKAQLGTPDYSLFPLQAQSSGAKILALNVAGDNTTPIKGRGIWARRPRYEDWTDVVPERRHSRRRSAGDARRSHPHQLFRGRFTGGSPLLRCLLCPPPCLRTSRPESIPPYVIVSKP